MRNKHLTGIGVSAGIRIGKTFVYATKAEHTQQLSTLPDAIIDPNALKQELERLQYAKEKSHEELSVLIEQTKQKLGEDKAAIISAQKTMLDDPSFFPEIIKRVEIECHTAEKAVQELTEQFASKFENMDNDYFKERAADIRDLGKRLLIHLSGEGKVSLADINEQVILVADDLTPSDTVQLNKEFILGFVTRVGGKTSHTAILAKSLGIPAIVGLGEQLDMIEEGETLIIDGGTGQCIVEPDEGNLTTYRLKRKEEIEQEQVYQHANIQSAITKDGRTFEIAANIGTPKEALEAIENGAEGVGLYRTEFLFMNQSYMPTEDEQFEAYKSVLQTMEGKPVVIRTLDIGGDKELPYLSLPEEMNPFLGYRAIRLCLDQQELFKTQLRAILRASTFGQTKIMFPMISSLEEFRAAKEIYEEVQQELTQKNISFDPTIEVGIMVEIPSVAIMADQFAQEVDFLSIGTNDLVQYTLAVDRMNEKVAYLYDYLHPAILQLIKQVIQGAHKHGKWVGMCGGMASDPLVTPLLIGMGLDEWSMDISSIKKVKYMVNQYTVEECINLVNHVLQLSIIEEVRAMLNANCKQ